ncbi:hypothetical protein [Sandaracinus amylolyticus]|uniref:hypothetical protein n=1 Tax=Sandaracinus amylolyticus TaxID=927083 RepID=UPI001F3A12C6|nr:hypothetical protein [Sandaracinus amylolyticus]
MRALAPMLCVLALSACDDLSRFRTDGNSLYRGDVVGDEGESFLRRGFAPGTSLELEFDPTTPDVPQPGTITSSPDPTSGERVFDATPLRSIAPLQHDLLSEYDFPGGGRVRNYLYVVRPESGPLAGRDAMAFVSLLDDGGVEVRIIAGAGDEASGDHFGLFRMRRVDR